MTIHTQTTRGASEPIPIRGIYREFNLKKRWTPKQKGELISNIALGTAAFLVVIKICLIAYMHSLIF